MTNTDKFNTKEMKVAFFDVDHKERDDAAMKDKTMDRLKCAINASIFRADYRNTDVVMMVVLAPTSIVTDEQSAELMAHIHSKKGRVIVTLGNLIVFEIGEGSNTYKITIDFSGGSKHIPVSSDDRSGDADTSDDSGYANIAGMGLTQECNLTPMKN